jgi:RNA polymerase sigma factor (sigma-70 family)
MKTDPSWSLRKISLAACTIAVAATFSAADARDSQTAVDSIQRYCLVSWRNAGIASQDWEDCTQEAIASLLERIPRGRLAAAIDDRDSGERRELNRAIWRIVQRWRRSASPLSLDQLGPLDPPSDEGRETISDDVQHVMEVARACLTPRQQKILSLYAEGRSIAEIADQLNLSSARTSDEKYKAIRKLRQHLPLAS